MENQIIILAGGKGTRMKSDRPKVLTKIKKISIIKHLLKNVVSVCAKPTIIVGYKGEEVIKETKNKYHYIWQKKQLGTGHAIACAKNDLIKNKNIKNIIVIPGDHPFVSGDTLKKLIKISNKNKAIISMATITVPNFENNFSSFYNCGRIIRNNKKEIEKIIELKDANEKQKLTKEVNVSYYCFNANWLWKNIEELKNNNKAKEYYLTDMIKIAVQKKKKISSIKIKNSIEGLGINNLKQLKILKQYCK